MATSLVTISELARQGGVGVETVRYYQRRGLLNQPERPPAGTSQGGFRHYGPDDVHRLRFIRSAQAAGFTLEQIGELLSLDATADRPRIHSLAMARIAALDAKIAALRQARDSLARLAHECGSEDAGACPIITAFEA